MSSSQKRKAASAPDSRPSKKQQTSSRPAKVELISSDSNVIKPVIATTPGASFPANVKFTSYVRTDKSSKDQSQLLLQSSDHPTIDYTAVEGAEPNEAHLKHYVAVYDPAAGTLKLAEAKYLSVRGSIRQAPKMDESDNEQNFPASQGTRAALTEAFGSKKSKKAVQAMAENRQLGQGIEGATIAEAITSHVKAEDEDDDEAAAAILARSNKPLPVPDLVTDDIHEVYSIRNLVLPKPAQSTLQQMPITAWMGRLKAGKEITGLRSRFVANRISYLGKQLIQAEEETTVQRYTEQLQMLRYIAMLLEIAAFLGKQSRMRKFPLIDAWPTGTLSADTPMGLVKQVVKRVFPENSPTEQAMTLLRTTILALTLHVLPPSGNWGTNQLATEPTDIQLDMALKADDVRKWLGELGCKVSGASERDLTTWGLSRLSMQKKDENGIKIPKPVFAMLKFPLSFPKSSGARKAKR